MTDTPYPAERKARASLRTRGSRCIGQFSTMNKTRLAGAPDVELSPPRVATAVLFSNKVEFSCFSSGIHFIRISSRHSPTGASTTEKVVNSVLKLEKNRRQSRRGSA